MPSARTSEDPRRKSVEGRDAWEGIAGNLSPGERANPPPGGARQQGWTLDEPVMRGFTYAIFFMALLRFER